MSYLPEIPAGAISIHDDGTGRYTYCKPAPGGGYDVYTKASAKAKIRFRKHVQTPEEAEREMDRFMENI